jgi:hypothetical protein
MPRGARHRLTPEPLAELVRWRRVDLQAVIARRFGIRRHARRDRQAPAPARLRPPVGAARRSAASTPRARPRHRKPSKNVTRRVQEALPAPAAGKPIEIWFEDG